jgi:hypothetical protein
MDHPEFEVGEKPYEKTFTPEPPAKQPRGCFFYGCMTAVVLGVFGLIAVVGVSYVVYQKVNKAIQDYTSTEPVPIPVVPLPDDQRKALDDRWQAFKTAVDKGEEAEIVLTADDINALIAEKPELKGKIHVSIKEDKVNGQVSIPLDNFGIPMTKGRFLNGTTELSVSIDYGHLDVRMKSLEINGKSPPPEVMASLGKENLAKDVKLDKENDEKLRQIESLEVKDGKIYLKARARSRDDEDKAGTKESTPAKEDDAAKDAQPPDAKGEAPKEAAKDEAATPKSP